MEGRVYLNLFFLDINNLQFLSKNLDSMVLKKRVFVWFDYKKLKRTYLTRAWELETWKNGILSKFPFLKI